MLDVILSENESASVVGDRMMTQAKGKWGGMVWLQDFSPKVWDSSNTTKKWNHN